jgi:hypothetical protein
VRACAGVNCPFPDPAANKPGDRWICPQCGTTYRHSRPIKRRWWRNWEAPAGEWRRRFGTRRLDRALSGQGSRWPSPPSEGEPGPAQRVLGAAASPPELADAFGQWALAQGIVPRLDEERVAVLLQAFIAGYRHAMAINAAELEIVKRAGYDVFRDGSAIGQLDL